MKKFLLVTICSAVLLLGAATAYAASTDAERFFVQPEIGLYGTSQGDVETILSYGVSGGIFVIDNLSIGGEFLGYYMALNDRDFDDEYNHTNGFGFNGLVRYHAATTEVSTFYFGTGLGGLFTDQEILLNGNENHLTLPVDVGFTYDITDQFSLDAGGRYQRIGFSSSGIDSWGGNVGMTINF